MTRSVKRPEPPPDPRSVGEVVLQTILAACKDDPEKLRKVLASIGDQAGDDVAILEQGITKRLNELEANLPGFERDGVASDVVR